MGRFLVLLLLFALLLPCIFGGSTTYNIFVGVSKEITELKHFWRSTGMCPPLPHQKSADYFLSQDMLQNLIHLGSIPHSGIKQTRMHWLLDMVKYNSDLGLYNFTSLDSLLDILHTYGLNPGFELMGSPSEKFTNFDDDAQVKEWMTLITTLAKRYISKFGLDVVSQWNFETWNEPDHKDFDKVVMSVEGFLKYYDACSEGLKSADPSLIFGGPGGSCRKKSFSKRCWALLDHCVNGMNYITGEKGSRIDYIAMHKKGAGSSSYIIETELETISEIHKEQPTLVNTSIFNDEADPMVGWSSPYSWRADATYPAIVAKIITQHQYRIMANVTSPIIYSLLSNDNGFLSYSPHYFTQRTLNARFQMNNTSPHHVHLVKKPIYSVMMLLSKLGNKQLQLGIKSNSTESDLVGAIASKCLPDSGSCASQEISVLTYASDDTSSKMDEFEVFLNLHHIISREDMLSASSVVMVHCAVDNKVSNPFKVWTESGMPDFPSQKIFEAMHDVSEPLCSDPVSFDTTLGDAVFNFLQPLPGVSLHHICWMPQNPPQAPVMLSVTNITSGQVLIAWDDSPIKTKCIRTYQVQLCFEPDCSSYKTLNTRKVISNSYVYITESGDEKDVLGLYRVSAIDYWNRSSYFSNGVIYNGQ